MQGGGAGAGVNAAVHESFNASTGDQPAEQAAVVDGAFLMDLLEDTPAADQAPDDVDRLSHVIRTLEAEISGGGRAAPLAPADGGSMLEHVPAGNVGSEGLEESILSDAPGPCVAEVPFEYCWTEVPPAVGHDMGGWYVDGDGLVVGYEFREQCYYGYNDSPHVEREYSPLWE